MCIPGTDQHGYPCPLILRLLRFLRIRFSAMAVGESYRGLRFSSFSSSLREISLSDDVDEVVDVFEPIEM